MESRKAACDLRRVAVYTSACVHVHVARKVENAPAATALKREMRAVRARSCG